MATPEKPTAAPSGEHQNPAAAADPQKVVDLEQAAARKEAERIQARNSAIKSSFQPFMQHDGVSALLTDVMADTGLSEAQAKEKLLAHLAAGSEPAGGNPHISAGVDESENRRKGMTQAIEARAGLDKRDPQNEFGSYTLFEMARMSLERAGVRVGNMNRLQVVAEGFTHTSSDFPNLLANIAHKSMLKGWSEAAETFEQWTIAGSLTDFKPAERTDINTFNSLDPVEPGSEYTYGTIGDRGEYIQLATYGKLFSITRQAIINDDLNAFTRIPLRMGRAAKRTVGNLVYAVLTSNPNMSDGNALFGAAHNNVASAAGSITTATVQAAKAAMMSQKDPDGNAVALNIPLKYLLVPVALEGVARQVANSQYEIVSGSASKASLGDNYVRGTFEPIADARLDAASTSIWYGVADPGTFDTIEVAYLDGNTQPYLEQQRGWDVDGMSYKVRIDAGVKALDFRTFYRNG